MAGRSTPRVPGREVEAGGEPSGSEDPIGRVFADAVHPTPCHSSGYGKWLCLVISRKRVRIGGSILREEIAAETSPSDPGIHQEPHNFPAASPEDLGIPLFRDDRL